MLYYRVYGHILGSNDPIPELPLATPGAVRDLDVNFSRSLCNARHGYTLRLVSKDRLASGEPAARLYESPAAYYLSYTQLADFDLSKSSPWMGVRSCEGSAPDEVRLFLLGPVLSFALELQGIPTLHASAVSLEGKAVAFVGVVRGGKSTLAASFMEAGYLLLTDDILPLDRKHDLVWVSPGYPQMRMWPDEAQHFLGHYEDLKRVLPTLSKRRVPVGPDGFGTFCDESQPLACLYLPVRREPAEWGTRIEITPISPRDAVIELVRHSFSASLVEPLGMQPQRLDFFARMVQQVPMRRLIYPAGYEHLPRVREAVLADVEGLNH